MESTLLTLWEEVEQLNKNNSNLTSTIDLKTDEITSLSSNVVELKVKIDTLS